MADYADQWKSAGYSSKMGSASFLPAPPNGFTRAYHFTSADYAVCAVALRQLKVARFADANDPFELLGVRIRKKSVRQAVKEFKNKCNQTTGLLCFSSDWTHPLLWSHYAAKHTGVCLGFNLKNEIVRRVTYENSRPDLEDGTDSFVVQNDLRERLLLTKSDYWNYESELRMIVDLCNTVKEGQLHFQSFNTDMILAEVILGERCTLQPRTVREVVQVTNPSAIVFRARTEFGTFRVKINGYHLQSVAEQLAAIHAGSKRR